VTRLIKQQIVVSYTSAAQFVEEKFSGLMRGEMIY
jgi:hypothetical protein